MPTQNTPAPCLPCAERLAALVRQKSSIVRMLGKVCLEIEHLEAGARLAAAAPQPAAEPKAEPLTPPDTPAHAFVIYAPSRALRMGDGVQGTLIHPTLGRMPVRISSEPVLAEAVRPAEPCTPPSRVSARVSAMLAQIGVDPGELSAPVNRRSPRGKRAMAARRAVIGKLSVEGLTRSRIADETGLTESTVYGHMRALRAQQEGV